MIREVIRRRSHRRGRGGHTLARDETFAQINVPDIPPGMPLKKPRRIEHTPNGNPALAYFFQDTPALDVVGKLQRGAVGFGRARDPIERIVLDRGERLERTD